MSGFQQYQFQTIDQPLSAEDRKTVSSWSSRAQVSATSASFVYHYGDFPKDPEKVLTEYFDAMLYISNWGTKQLLFRLPLKLVDEKTIKQYAIVPEYSENYVDFYPKGASIVLDIHMYDNDGLGWLEEDDYDLSDLISLREDIINGDYRSLFLAWLAVAQMVYQQPEKKESDSDYFQDEDYDHYNDEVHEEDPDVPPIPSKLNHLSASLQAFANYFDVKQDYIAAAASKSSGTEQSKIDCKKLLKKLSQTEQESFLLRLLNGEPLLGKLLRKRLEDFAPQQAEVATARVSWEELLELTGKKEKQRLAKEAKLAQIAHEKKMLKVEKNKEQHWESVFFNLDKKTGKSYDHATATLKNLHDMYAFRGMYEVFEEKMINICEQYGRSKVLLNRFKKAGLPCKN